MRLPCPVFTPIWIRLATLSVLCLSAIAALAQEGSGVLQGTVSDDTDAVLPGVTVTLTDEVTNRVLSTSAGSYGNYSLRRVEPGRYSVTFELAGFSRAVYPAIDVLNAQTLRLDVVLKPGPVTTTVQVVDSAPLIDLQG